MRFAPFIVLLCPAVLWAQGPIETRNGRAASLAFLRLGPRGELLRPGERLLGLQLLSANNLKFEGPTREDQETERLGLRLRWGVRQGEWSLELPFLARGGGFQDPFIEGWHSLFGINNFRGTIPFGRSEQTLPGSGSFGSAAGIGDVNGAFSRPIGPNAFFSVGLKLPTGNAGGLLGSGGVDFAASYYQRWKLANRFDLHGQLGGVVQGDTPRLSGTRSLVHEESLALVFRANSRDEYVLQWQGEPSALKTGDATLDGPHRQLSFGFSRRVGAKDWLQLYFNEDGDFLNYRVPALVNLAPDFTIGVNYSRRW